MIPKLLFTTQHFKISPFDHPYILSWWKIKKKKACFADTLILYYGITLSIVVRVEVYSELRERKYCW